MDGWMDGWMDGVHCQESAGTGPVDFKVVPVTGAVFSGVTWNQLLWASALSSHTNQQRLFSLKSLHRLQYSDKILQ